MNRLRLRLILSHLAPLFLVAPLVAIALIYLIETQLEIEQLSGELTAQAEVIAQVANSQPGIWRDPQIATAYIERINAIGGYQITLLDSTGVVLAATDPYYHKQQGAIADDFEPMRSVGDGERFVHIGDGVSASGRVADIAIPARNEQDQVVGIVRVTEELSTLTSQFDRLRQWLIWLLLIELVVGAVLGLIFALSLERPLRRLTNAIQGVTTGRQVAPLAATGPQEMQQLAQSFNHLVARLNLLEEARRRLLANLVHELGRPLGAMRAAVQALRRGGDQEPGLRQDLLVGLDDQISHLEPLLADMSQLHEQALGTYALDYRATDLSAWLPTLLPTWRLLAEEKGVYWQVDVPAGLPTIDIDPTRLSQAIGNLLSNAIKYTNSGGTIMTSAGVDDDRVWIRIRDNGMGIPASELSEIFEPFYRGQQQRRFPQGLGLGLTIARDLTQAHGGWLTAHSIVNEGSQFTIYLPISLSPNEA